MIYFTPEKKEIFWGDLFGTGGGAKMPPVVFSKIINSVTFKLGTKVARLKYFKKWVGNTEGDVTFLLRS